MDTIKLTGAGAAKLVQSISEGHFQDAKDCRIAPSKLSQTISAFSNADGGELFVGISEGKRDKRGTFLWRGFLSQENANPHLQVFEEIFPTGDGFTYTFLEGEGCTGTVLKIECFKSQAIRKSTDGSIYIRKGAQNLRVDSEEGIMRLKLNKGLTTFEDETLPASADIITDALPIYSFMLDVVPNTEPDRWLRKQALVKNQKPTVAGLLLFGEEPQAYMPKSACKIYRYKSDREQDLRKDLAFDPVSVEGHLYNLVKNAVSRTVTETEKIQKVDTEHGGLRTIKYPPDALHEIITNAIIHRDYSIQDDVHVRIYDNRIEVQSPGRLPAHVTPENILDERFARNPKIVRIINKFPTPPNKDVGEGLNTAFRAMKELRLREPEIIQKDNAVLVILRHESLDSPAVQIVQQIRENGSINNAEARQVTGIESDSTVRGIFRRLVKSNTIEVVPGTSKGTTRYRLTQDSKHRKQD